MSWEEYLRTLYLRICKDYEENLGLSCQRFTNGGYKQFTDEEVMLFANWLLIYNRLLSPKTFI